MLKATTLHVEVEQLAARIVAAARMLCFGTICAKHLVWGGLG